MKNRFPLDVVLMVRRNSEDKHAVRLKAIMEKRSELLESLRVMRRAVEQLEERRAEQVAAFELASGQKYREMLYKRCNSILAEIEKVGAQESAQRKELMNALKERKKLEKLKDIWAGKLALKLEKIESAEMDETARFQFAREAL